MQIRLTVNGAAHDIDIDPRVTLLDALREYLRLCGTKKGCDHGQCGACTVLVDGRRVNACLTLAVMNSDVLITTIEGLGGPDALSPLQAAFVACDGLQCGFCTPGQIMSATGMMAELAAVMPSHVSPDLSSTATVCDTELAERMSGNLCRCSAYVFIREAISSVAGGQA